MQPFPAFRKIAHTLLIVVAGTVFLGCHEAKPTAGTNSSNNPPPSSETHLFNAEAYQSLDGASGLTLISPDECELHAQSTILLCKYNRTPDALRVVTPTSHVIYFRFVEEGIQDNDGRILLSKKEYDQARTRELAVRVLEDLKIIDAASDRWAIVHNARTGDPIPVKELADFLVPGKPLSRSCKNGEALDSLGNPIIIKGADSLPNLSRRTFDHFSSIVPPSFWSPYTVDQN